MLAGLQEELPESDLSRHKRDVDDIPELRNPRLTTKQIGDVEVIVQGENIKK